MADAGSTVEEKQQAAAPKAEEGEEKKSEQQEGSEKPAEEANEVAPPKEMRAIVLSGFGGLKSVKVLKKPEPAIANGDVLIRVKACGLGFQDLMVRQGAIDSPPKAPFILGFECAGEVEAVGEEVKDLKVGDRVAALPEYRAWSELVAVPATYVYKIPDDMSFADAVALTMNYVVAYSILFELGGLSAGKSLLVHSAGGGVGQAVAQLSRTLENINVFGVASKVKHEDIKDSLNTLIERGSDYVSEVRKISPEGVDLVLDCLCGEECNRGYSLLKPMGRYILYGSSNIVTGETKSFFSVAKSWWQVDKVSPIKLFDENKTLSGFNLRHLLYQQGGTAYVRSLVEKVYSLWQAGKVKPVIDSRWAFEDVAEAMQKMHDRKNVGKMILDPSQEPKPKPPTPSKGKNKGGDAEKEKLTNEGKTASVESSGDQEGGESAPETPKATSS